MTSSRSTQRSNYQGLCDVAYQTTLAIKKYSFKEMADILEDFYTKTVSQGASAREIYLLRLRIDYFLKELSISNSDLIQALIALYSISPYITKKLVAPTAVNVFLARDAAREYITATLMQRLGRMRNRIHIIHLSRKNLKTVYGIVRKRRTIVSPRKAAHTELVHELRRAYSIEPSVRKEIREIKALLERSGLLHEPRIRFIDTWTSGSIFVALSVIINICDQFELGTTTLTKKASPLQRSIEFATANNKKRVRVVDTIYDYENVAQEFSEWWRLPKSFYSDYSQPHQNLLQITSFDCALITKKTIHSWYQYYGCTLPRSVVVQELCELASAQIFKKFNHFGSLNFGHPIEWDARGRCVVSTPSYKKVGNLFRTMFLINAVVGYYEDYRSPIVQAPLPPLSNRERTRRLRLWRTTLRPASLRNFDEVAMASNEHVVTCDEAHISNLLRNIDTVLHMFGPSAVARMTALQNYNFQFFLNQTKKIPNSEFLVRLRYLKRVYGLRTVRTMFFQNSFYFEKEVQQAFHLYERTKRKPATIVFDIDGTLTPIEKGITVVRECVKSNIEPIFITGRPRRFCLTFANAIISKSPRALHPVLRNLYFYASNGAESLVGIHEMNRTREVIPRHLRDAVLHVGARYGFKIISEREYRIIIGQRKWHAESDPNMVLAVRDEIEQIVGLYGLGVYMINWNTAPGSQSFYNAIDICASSKGRALTQVLATRSNNKVLIIGDDPHNSDRDILQDHGISVQGYGVMKTRAIVKYVSGRRSLRT